MCSPWHTNHLLKYFTGGPDRSAPFEAGSLPFLIGRNHFSPWLLLAREQEVSNRLREIVSKEPGTPVWCSLGEPEALSGSPPWGWAVPFRLNTIESHQLSKILWSPLVFSRCVNNRTSLKVWRSGQLAEHLPGMHWDQHPLPPTQHWK